MSIGCRLCVVLPGLAIWCVLLSPLSSRAECVIESEPGGRIAFVKHMSKACTEDERLTHAVRAEELLQAIQRGQEVDLAGVVVVGDLFLDQLPVVDVPPQGQLPPLMQELVASRGVTTVRVISRAISIRDSRIVGTIATKLKEGYLLMQGPVTMTGTTCEGLVDLSRTMFSDPVNLSNAVFQREALFLQTVFNKPVQFKQAVFGVHTRFHRAQFGEAVTFEGAGFNGLAEFLEVTFDKEADFSRSHFKSGTGFSGAQFLGTLDFSDARFDRDVYFLFTRFAGRASFRSSTFGGQADFSDAEFREATDFTHVSFAVDPKFQRTTLSRSAPTRAGEPRPQVLYGIAASLLVLTVLMVWIFRSR